MWMARRSTLHVNHRVPVRNLSKEAASGTLRERPARDGSSPNKPVQDTSPAKEDPNWKRHRYQRPLGWGTLGAPAFFALFCIAFLLSVPETSLAQSDDARARLLFDNGHQLYMEGRYEDALAAWTEAYALSQRPLILFNMANAYERNGQLEKAVAVLNRYRAYAQPDEQEVILRRIKNMEQRLAQAQPQPIEQSVCPTPTAPFPDFRGYVDGFGGGDIGIWGSAGFWREKPRKPSCTVLWGSRYAVHARCRRVFRKRETICDGRRCLFCRRWIDNRGWPRTVVAS